MLAISLLGVAFAVAAAAEVVDDDLGAARGEEQGVGAAEAAAGAGDDGDAAIKSNITHGRPPIFFEPSPNAAGN